MINLCSISCIKPMVNKIELDPFNQQIEAQKWMQKSYISV